MSTSISRKGTILGNVRRRWMNTGGSTCSDDPGHRGDNTNRLAGFPVLRLHQEPCRSLAMSSDLIFITSEQGKKLVDALYGLTQEEIKIVESAAK